MDYFEEWEKEEADLIPEDWTEEDIIWWNKFVPYLREALIASTQEEIRRIEANTADMPDIEFDDDFKIKINKLFRDNFGVNCKVPHPEVECRVTTKV